MENITEIFIIGLMIFVLVPMAVLLIYLAYSQRKSYQELLELEREIMKEYSEDKTEKNIFK